MFYQYVGTLRTDGFICQAHVIQKEQCNRTTGANIGEFCKSCLQKYGIHPINSKQDIFIQPMTKSNLIYPQLIPQYHEHCRSYYPQNAQQWLLPNIEVPKLSLPNLNFQKYAQLKGRKQRNMDKETMNENDQQIIQRIYHQSIKYKQTSERIQCLCNITIYDALFDTTDSRRIKKKHEEDCKFAWKKENNTERECICDAKGQEHRNYCGKAKTKKEVNLERNDREKKQRKKRKECIMGCNCPRPERVDIHQVPCPISTATIKQTVERAQYEYQRIQQKAGKKKRRK